MFGGNAKLCSSYYWNEAREWEGARRRGARGGTEGRKESSKESEGKEKSVGGDKTSTMFSSRNKLMWSNL